MLLVDPTKSSKEYGGLTKETRVWKALQMNSCSDWSGTPADNKTN